MRDKPFVHLFKVHSKEYLYDVNMDTILRIPVEVFEYYSEGKNSKIAQNYIAHYKQLGYLKSNRVEKTEHPDTKYIQYYHKNFLNTLILQVTQNCNLTCDYCIYSGSYRMRKYSEKRMTWDMAKNGVDYLIQHSIDAISLTIGFYGGEPLLEFNLIKMIVAYIRERIEGKKVFFNITTNATLLTDEIMEFFVKNKFTVLISFDGPKEYHDSARKFAESQKGSYDIVIKKLSIFKAKYPDYYKKHIMFNTVLDPSKPYSRIEKYIKKNSLFKNNFFLSTYITNVYAVEKRAISKENIEDMQYEKFITLMYMLGRVSKENKGKLLQEDNAINEIFDSQGSVIKIPQIGHRNGPCTPGYHKLFMNVDGDFFPCERVSECSKATKIGNIFSGLDTRRCEEMLNLQKLTEEECRNCWAYLHCSTCIVYADDLNKLSRVNILKQCKNVTNSLETVMKDYVVLKELGYSYSKE